MANTTLNTGAGRVSVTPAQIDALRHLLDNHPDSATVGKPTARVLLGLGLIQQGNYSSVGITWLYSLTPAGHTAIGDHVKRTGDGPEALKRMFRF